MIYVHRLDPVLLRIGPIQIAWYGVMYALAFLTGYWFLLRESRRPGSPVSEAQVPDLLTYLVLGVIVGGRLGWVLFYGGRPYLEEPWRIVQTWKGGMSFHGGLLGVALALVIFSRRHRASLLALGDLVISWVPVGLFLGRIGNFINGELYGKPTNGHWGVIFPGDPLQLPRHPSQLYEAALEGVLLFVALAVLRRRPRPGGFLVAAFLVLYGVARVAVEFVRVPDADLGYLWRFVTMGQVLSVPMIVVGLIWMVKLAWPETAGRDERPRRRRP